VFNETPTIYYFCLIYSLERRRWFTKSSIKSVRVIKEKTNTDSQKTKQVSPIYLYFF
jgi:hypothetical protein